MIEKIDFNKAQINKIYVTQGGLVETDKGKKFPWGYERVLLLQKDIKNHIYIFKTPWGTELEISGDYVLYSTPETEIFSEHKLIGTHKKRSLQKIPFDKAIERGLCILNIQHSTQTDIKQNLIEYFKDLHKISDAVKYFKIQYPRIRGYIETIRKSGISGIKYKIIESQIDNKKAIQIQKEQ